MSLPKKTLARTIVSMQGYTDEQCIHEIMAHDGIGPDDTLDTGRVFSQILLPLERRGLLVEIRDDDGRFIGYGDYTEHEGSLGM